MKLLIATGNPGKLDELRQLFAGLPLELVSLKDVGLGDMDVEESGMTLAENATLKARAYSNASGLPTLADDTGLFVDAIGGEPGIYPARYGGPDLTMPQRREKLLNALGDTPADERTARFVAVIAIADPASGAVETVEGVFEGRIAQAVDDGGQGFGYDPLFIPQGYNVTASHLPPDEKNRISHRGRAAQAAIPVLRRMFGL